MLIYPVYVKQLRHVLTKGVNFAATLQLCQYIREIKSAKFLPDFFLTVILSSDCSIPFAAMINMDIMTKSLCIRLLYMVVDYLPFA